MLLYAPLAVEGGQRGWAVGHTGVGGVSSRGGGAYLLLYVFLAVSGGQRGRAVDQPGGGGEAHLLLLSTERTQS